MNGEKESFNLFEIPATKKRNPPTMPLIHQDVSSETKKSNASAPNIVASRPLVKSPEREPTPISAQNSCPLVSISTAEPTQPPPAPVNPPKSRLSGFSLPLFSSTPLNPGIFSHKRRTSSKKGRKQNATATSPSPVNEVVPQGSTPKTPPADKKVVDEKALGDSELKESTPSSDRPITPPKTQNKSQLGLNFSPQSPRKGSHVRTPLSAEKGTYEIITMRLIDEKSYCFIKLD